MIEKPQFKSGQVKPEEKNPKEVPVDFKRPKVIEILKDLQEASGALKRLAKGLFRQDDQANHSDSTHSDTAADKPKPHSDHSDAGSTHSDSETDRRHTDHSDSAHNDHADHNDRAK